MKKLTKKEKDEIKRKVLKTVNIISYILSGLFVVVLLISMVQSCSPKNEINNNENQTTETRQAQRLQEGTKDYMYPVGTLGNADIDNPFPLDGKSSAYVITDFNRNMYAVSGITFVDYLTNITENNTKVYNFPSGVYFSFSVQLCINTGGGSITFDENIISQPTGFIYSIEYFDADTEGGNLIYIYRIITSNGTFDIGFYYTDENSLGASMYITCMFTTLRNNCEMPKFLIDTCTYMYPKINDNYTTLKDYILNNEEFSTKYELPPYLIIEKDVQSFVYNIGGSLGLLRFDKIIYEYHKSLYFTTIGGNRYVWNYDININGDYIFTPKMTTTDYITGSGQSGTIPLYEWFEDIPILEFTSFGTLGKYFIDSYFINTNNDLLNNTYNLNASYFFRLLTSELVVSIESDYTLQFLPHNEDFSFENPNYSMDLDMKLLVNDNYYKSITFRYGLNLNTTLPTLGAIYIYTNIDNNYYDNPTLSPLLLGIEYNNNQFTLTSDLLDVSQNDFLNKANLKLFNVDISSDLWNLVGTAFIPYELTGNFDIVYGDNDNIALGNVFTLLGGAFGGIASLMGITIIPGITLGILLFIPLIILIVLFIVHLFKR